MAEFVYMKYEPNNGALDFTEEIKEYATNLKLSGIYCNHDIEYKQYSNGGYGGCKVATGARFKTTTNDHYITFCTRERGYCATCRHYHIGRQLWCCPRCGNDFQDLIIDNTLKLSPTTDTLIIITIGKTVTIKSINKYDVSAIKPVAVWVKNRLRLKPKNLCEDGWRFRSKDRDILITPKGVIVLTDAENHYLEYADPNLFNKILQLANH